MIVKILTAVAQCEAEETAAMPNVMQVDKVTDYLEMGTVDHIIQNYLVQCLITSDTRQNAVSLIQKLLQAIEAISLRTLIQIVEVNAAVVLLFYPTH